MLTNNMQGITSLKTNFEPVIENCSSIQFNLFKYIPSSINADMGKVTSIANRNDGSSIINPVYLTTSCLEYKKWGSEK
jgi:hypothetical protein